MSKRLLLAIVATGLLIVLGLKAWETQPEENGSPVVMASVATESRTASKTLSGGEALALRVGVPGDSATGLAFPSVAKQEATPNALREALKHTDGRSEKIFVADNALVAENLPLLGPKAVYSEFIRDLNRNASSEAAQKTLALRDRLFQDESVSSGKIVVGEVGCGATLCSFSVTGPDDDSVQAFAHGQLKNSSKSFPAFSGTTLIGQTDGRSWVRVLVSTDPKVNSIRSQ